MDCVLWHDSYKSHKEIKLFCVMYFVSFCRYSPIGIAFLLAARIVAMEDPALAFYQLTLYIITVLLGLTILMFAVLGFIYTIFTRNNPLHILCNSKEALLTALATASR